MRLNCEPRTDPSMKTKTIVTFLLLTAFCVIARLPYNFMGWDRLKTESPEIIIAGPKEPTPPEAGVVFENGPDFDFSITVLSVLKGTNGMRHARLLSDHELRPRDAYLVFGKYENGIYKANGEFSVVPLGRRYKREMISGKTLDDQIRVLIQLAIDNLDSEMASKQVEKARLETIFKK